MLQICAEYERFKKAMPTVKVGNFFGGLPVKTQREELKAGAPSIVVGTPGRVKQVFLQAYERVSAAVRTANSALLLLCLC